MLLTNTDPEGKKMEWNAAFPRCSRLFLVWHPANFTKSINHSVHTVAHRHDTTHILGTKNQSIWAWQSSQSFCSSVSNISWKCYWNPFTNFSVMLLVSMDPENIKIKIVPCFIFDLSWKFHENQFTRFSVMLLTDTDSPEKNRKRNHVCKGFNRTSPKSSRLFLVPSLTYPATFMKSVHAFSCDIANRKTNQQIGIKT